MCVWWIVRIPNKIAFNGHNVFLRSVMPLFRVYIQLQGWGYVLGSLLDIIDWPFIPVHGEFLIMRVWSSKNLKPDVSLGFTSKLQDSLPTCRPSLRSPILHPKRNIVIPKWRSYGVKNISCLYHVNSGPKTVVMERISGCGKPYFVEPDYGTKEDGDTNPIHFRERLGGLLKFSYRKAA